MPDDFYSGDEETSHEADSGMEGGGGDTGMGKEDHETTLIPRSLFGGHDPKPNEEYYFKVIATHGDEIEIAYSQGEEKEESEMGGQKEGSDTADQAFSDHFSSMK